MINEIVFGWTISTNSGIGKILFPMKYFAYCSLFLAKSSGDFFSVDQEIGVSCLFCAGWIVLAGSDESCEDEGNDPIYPTPLLGQDMTHSQFF